MYLSVVSLSNIDIARYVTKIVTLHGTAYLTKTFLTSFVFVITTNTSVSGACIDMAADVCLQSLRRLVVLPI
jgi:hypothetical protein